MRLNRASAIIATCCLACASPGLPPGGPPDRDPPTLVSASPESGSVNVSAKAVLLRFDEVINERSAPTSGGGVPSGGGFGGYAGGAIGGSSLTGLVLLSPSDGRERVQWRRTAIEIEPRGGFRANTTYRVTLLPGLADLRGNILREQREIVFSTGSTLPNGEIGGAVFDWAAGRGAPLARVEAVLGDDSTFRWSARADSLGRYLIRDLAPGRYRIRAWIDANSNRALDVRESFDSITVALDARGDADLYAFAHDTIGPRIERVEPVDSTALRIRFDRALAVDWVPDSSSLTLQRADSSTVALGVMMPAERFDSLTKASRAASDTAAADPTEAAAAPTPDVAVAAGAAGAAGRPTASDTAVRRGPPFARPVPVRDWVVLLGTPLGAGEYRLHTAAIPALGGARGDSVREFRVRPPATPPPGRDASKTAAPPAAATRPPTR